MILHYIKVGAIAICISSLANVFMGYISFAQQSELRQQIQPFECIYTTTQTGGGSNMDSTCDGQPVPVLTSIELNNGRPVLHGTFDASRSIMLRVWINGQWYTLGVDARLTTAGDDWSLDLSGLANSLQPGIYIIMAEVETDDGLLLHNTDAGSFIVPVLQQDMTLPITQPFNPSRPFQLSGIIPTIMPRTQAPDDLLGKYPSIAPRIDQQDRRDSASTINDNSMTYVYIISIIAAIIGLLWFVRRWSRR